MRRVPPKLNSQSGLSIVELLIVCIIIAVVSSLALLQRGSANDQFQRQNVSRELKYAFERARFDSVKRHAEGAGPAEVVVEPDRFTLWTDSDLNAAGLESAVTLLPANISIARFEGGSGTVTISFDKRGEISITGATNPIFLVCNASCSAANDTSSNANIVLITVTGTVNMLMGGVTPQPSFTPPVVAAPIANAASVDLNQWGQVSP